MRRGRPWAMRRFSMRSCAYCRRPHDVSDAVAEENPFCRVCLPERVQKRASSFGPVEAVLKRTRMG